MQKVVAPVKRDYLVFILGEEFRVKGITRWDAKSQGAHDYDDKYPGKYKISLLIVIARIRQLPEACLEVK